MLWFKRSKKSHPKIPVITGIGVVSPIGEGVDAWWDNLCAGKSGINRITQFDPTSYPCTSAAEVKNWDPSKYMPQRYVQMLSRGAQFALAAFQLAKENAGLEWFDPYNTDVILGAGANDFHAIEKDLSEGLGIHYFPDGDPTGVLQTMISTPASLLSFKAGTKGYVTTHVSACVSGIDSVNHASQRIYDGIVHTGITGGMDTYVSKMLLQAFCSAKAVAFDTGEEPKSIVKPFDKNRTKSVLGEGACIFIIEEKTRAMARNAPIYCELIPASQGAEGNNIAFTPEKSGDSWKNVIQSAVQNEKIDHINAHGPGDKIVDRIEAGVFKKAFGKDLNNIGITSIKATTGGGNAFASSCQIAAGAKAILDQRIPPTVNYSTPDPELEDLHSISASSVARNIDHVLINAHGMGGMNAAMVMRKIT